MKYDFIMEDFVWSYSRIGQYEQCPYGFLLKYIKGEKPVKHFFSEYGKLVHEILAEYYKGAESKEKCLTEYIGRFNVIRNLRTPNRKIVTTYFKNGFDYLRNLDDEIKNVTGVEMRRPFCVDGIACQGIVDLIKNVNGELVLIDHKSRTLKPRSNRAVPTAGDKELDKYLRQLYVYGNIVKDVYKKFPDKLAFNCFRENQEIIEPFQKEKFDEAQKWLSDNVTKIREESEWRPDPEWFKCNFICDMRDSCEYVKYI